MIRMEIGKYLKIMLLLFISVGLIVVFRSFLIVNVIDPFVLIFWVIWRIIAAVDQNIYWAILILFSMICMFRLLKPREQGRENPAYNYHYHPPSQVEYWRLLIRNAQVDRYDAEKLRSNLIDIYGGIKDIESRPSKLKSTWESPLTDLSLPPSVQLYLFSSNEKNRKRFSKTNVQKISFLPIWLRVLVDKNVNADLEKVDETIKWMENNLGIYHEK